LRVEGAAIPAFPRHCHATTVPTEIASALCASQRQEGGCHCERSVAIPVVECLGIWLKLAPDISLEAFVKVNNPSHFRICVSGNPPALSLYLKLQKARDQVSSL